METLSENEAIDFRGLVFDYQSGLLVRWSYRSEVIDIARADSDGNLHTQNTLAQGHMIFHRNRLQSPPQENKCH